MGGGVSLIKVMVTQVFWIVQDGSYNFNNHTGAAVNWF